MSRTAAPGDLVNRESDHLATFFGLAALLMSLAVGGCSEAVSPQPKPARTEQPQKQDPPSDPHVAAPQHVPVETHTEVSNGTQPESVEPEVGPDEGAQDTSKPEPTPEGEAKAKLFEGIKIDRTEREVRIPAKLAMENGILEFLVVTEDGRTHEAVFTTKIKPSVLHLALLTVGLLPSGPIQPGTDWYAKALKGRARLGLDVEHESNGETVRYPVSELLKNRESRDGETPDTWVFAGSYFVPAGIRRQYAGDRQDVIISIIPAPEAVVQFATPLTNPYHEDPKDWEKEFGLEYSESLIGPVGTEVTLVFSQWDEERDW
jgi:hypothetical protein